MRKIASNLAAHFAGGATTLCHCWKVIRQDGTLMGFTDHDCDLRVNGVTYLANTGLDGTKIDHALGLSVGGMEVNGALTADGLLADDIINGKYDNATIEYWLVNWADVTQTLLLVRSSAVNMLLWLKCAALLTFLTKKPDVFFKRTVRPILGMPNVAYRLLAQPIRPVTRF